MSIMCLFMEKSPFASEEWTVKDVNNVGEKEVDGFLLIVVSIVNVEIAGSLVVDRCKGEKYIEVNVDV